MDNLIRLSPKSATTLREAYRSAVAEGYNSTVEVGRFDRACAQAMVGFLSAAVIALRLGGDAVWASLFDGAAQSLNEDWTLYEREIPALAAALEATP